MPPDRFRRQDAALETLRAAFPGLSLRVCCLCCACDQRSDLCPRQVIQAGWSDAVTAVCMDVRDEMSAPAADSKSKGEEFGFPELGILLDLDPAPSLKDRRASEATADPLI